MVMREILTNNYTHMRTNYYFPIYTLFFLCLGCVSTSVLFAQDPNTGEDAASLAKELANPNATRGQLFNQFDLIGYNGESPNSSQTGLLYSLQPSLPIPISEGTNVFIRPLIPVYLSQPTMEATGFSQRSGLGNISVDVAIGKTWPSKWIGLIGVFAGFPTSTVDELRSNFTTVGPEVVIGKVTSYGFLGLLVNHAWSVNSNDPSPQSFTILSDSYWTTTAGRTRASVTAGQYFYTVDLKNAWQISAAPTFSYNHEAEEGDKFIFPLGTGITKVSHIGKLPMKFGIQYWYYVASPDSFGPQHMVRIQLTPVVPLPW